MTQGDTGPARSELPVTPEAEELAVPAAWLRREVDDGRRAKGWETWDQVTQTLMGRTEHWGCSWEGASRRVTWLMPEEGPCGCAKGQLRDWGTRRGRGCVDKESREHRACRWPGAEEGAGSGFPPEPLAVQSHMSQREADSEEPVLWPGRRKQESGHFRFKSFSKIQQGILNQ